MSVQIGNWVKRPPRGKWHLVDSTIEDRVVTRCGREMERETWRGVDLFVSEVQPFSRSIGQPQLCKAGCDR